MKFNIMPTRRHWAILTALAAVTASVIAAGALFAATGTEQQSLSLHPEQAPESVGTQAADDREQIKLPPIEKRPPAYPKLDSSLNRLAENAAAAASSTARSDSAESRTSEPALATFYVQGTRVDDLLHHLVEKNAYIRNIGEDYIEAHVPPSLLGEASEQPGVLRVDKVILPRSKQSQDRAISQGVGLHGATAWHSAGYRGNNVKVGVIDSGFEGIQQMLNRKYPANARYNYYCFYETATPPANVLNGCTTNGNHGTAVTETLLDVAPRVQLYFSNPQTNGDLRRAVDWMASEGVTVINHSISKMVDGPGDGTSPYSNSPLRTIDAAVAQGITWVNSAGNDAKKVWYGALSDHDNDRWHSFNYQDETNRFTVEAGEEAIIFMRWNDQWGRADCDLDLAVVKWNADAEKWALVSESNDVQDGSAGRNPREILEIDSPGTYDAVVRIHDCQQDQVSIQLTAWRIENDLEYYSASHHIGNPEESRNPGMLAVGATHYSNTHEIAPYSSRGPSLSGHTKPDITGVACARSSVYRDGGNGCGFGGTSQSAPHVAGLAALVLQRFSSYTPAQVTSYLRQNAVERGIAGADNTWGSGFAYLPRIQANVSPTPHPTPVGNPTPTPTRAPAPTVVPGITPTPAPTPGTSPAPSGSAPPPVTNIAVRDAANAGEVVVSWDHVPAASHYRVGYVNMETDYPLAKASLTGNWLEAFVYVDVESANFTVVNGRVQYVLRRLEQGVRHAVTVLSSGDVLANGRTVSGTFSWPNSPTWVFHTVANRGGTTAPAPGVDYISMYPDCQAVQLHFPGGVRQGSPIYRASLDTDNDGVACEPASTSPTGNYLPIHSVGSFSGTGDSAHHVLRLAPGLYRITTTRQNLSGNVFVYLIEMNDGDKNYVGIYGRNDPGGQELETVYDDGASYRMQAGNYILEIDTSSDALDWTVTVELLQAH